jgi:hypothetical protein
VLPTAAMRSVARSGPPTPHRSPSRPRSPHSRLSLPAAVTTTRNHYQQAVDNFLHHNYEAANGALRTTLEDLVSRLAREHAGYVGQGKPGEGGRAINHMVDMGSLPENDGGLLLKGIWKLAHTRGSHPGRSDAEEARFRMVIITAIARFLLDRFPKQL